MVRVRTCCNCFRLRTGCILIALFDIVLNISMMSLGVAGYMEQGEMAVSICHCIACLILLFGAIIESTVLLIFFLISHIVIVLVLLVLIGAILAKREMQRIVFVLAGVTSICMNVYFWIVVYSLYRQLSIQYEDEEYGL